MHGLVKNHGYTDGNKRTALIATNLLIERSGYQLVLGEIEFLDDIVFAVASGEMTETELSNWFQIRLSRRSE